MADLQTQTQQLKQGGFSQVEINNWQQEKVKQLQEGGFTSEEIVKDFGFEPVDTTAIKKIYEKDLAIPEIVNYDEIETIQRENPDDKGFLEAAVGKKLDNVGERIAAGWNTGVIDLIQEAHGIPNIDGTKEDGKYFNVDFQDTGFLERNITNAARIVKDLPLYFGVGGASLFATRSPNASIFTSGLVVGSIRETYLDMREKGQVANWNNFWEIFRNEGIKAGLKEGTQLLSAAKLGGLSNKFLPQLIGRVAGFEGSGAIIERELPSKDQLIDSVILFGAFGLGERGAKKIPNIIKKTNRDAVDLAADYKLDKSVKQDLASKNLEIPRAIKRTVEDITGKKIKLDEKFLEGLEFPEAVKLILSKTKFEKPKDVTDVKNTLTRLFIDRLHPILRLVQRVESTKNTKGQLNVYEQFRILVGMTNRGGSFIDRATQTVNLENKGKPLKQVLEPLKFENAEAPLTKLGVSNKKLNEQGIKKQYAELNAYLIARRALEYDRRGFKHPFDSQAAKETIQILKNKYDPIAKEIDVYNRQLLEYARDLKLIDKEAFDAMVEANKSYVPFSRVLETVKGEKPSKYGGVSNPFKRIKGDETLKVFDPIETIYSNTFKIVKLAERNNALIKFFDFVEKNKSSFPDINKKIETKQTKIERKELEKVLDDPSAINDAAIENFKVFRKSFVKPDGSSVTVYRNGKYEVWDVGKELADSLSEFNPQEMGVIIRAIGTPARLLRAGATTSPDFIFSNIGRDTVLGAVFSKSGFIPVWSSLEGGLTMLLGKTGVSKKAKKIMQDWEKSGGMQSTLISLDRMVNDKSAFKILNGQQIRNKVFNPLEILRTLSEIGENITRLGEFQKAYKKAGKEGLKGREQIERAGFESRDITIDYAKMGAYMKGVNAISAFYNARVQGYVKIYDGFKQRPGRTIATITAGIIMPSVYFWFANRDNEIYQRQPQWVKDNYWVVVVGDTPYRIPKPFDLGVVFGTGMEQFLDYWYGNEANAKNDLSRFVTEFVSSQLRNLNPLPTILVPPIEQKTNYSIFKGKPLVPDYMDKQLLGPYQFNPYTTETSKLLSRTLAAMIGDHNAPSPIVIDNYIRGWTGGLGNYFMMALDKALIETGIIDDPIRPTDSLTKIPGLRAFNLRDPSMQSEFITDFYEEYKKYKKYKPTIEKLKKDGDFKEAAKLAKRKKLIDKNIAVLERYKTIIDQHNEYVRKAFNMKNVDPDQKQQIIDDMVFMSIKMAQEALKILYYEPNNDS
ncbi:hypothetical protein [uncultured Mediterranean phage uvDeep-CGR2-KM24-C165]|nr:hypothetical protein [uncultured Mediterranean phage uvDeep-CGR2-KM24-C165]